MAYFGVTASAAGLHAAAPGEDLAAGLRRRLRDGADGAPVVVLVHGFKFHPDVPGADPHRSLFALRPAGDGRRIRSWPEGLGFRDDGGESGLCVGFAWPASAPMLGSLVTTGRTGFARVYDRAAGYGARLAELVALLQRLAPGRPVDLLAHSLGARVALAALPALEDAPGRVILLGAAELDARARDFLARLPRAGPAADLQRHRPRQRPLRPRLRDLRPPPRPRRAGAGARARRAAPAMARPAARPRRGHGLGQRPRHPADRRERPALPLGLLHPRRGARGLRGDPAPPARLGHREPPRRPLLRGAGAALEPAAAAPPGAAAAAARDRRDLTRA